MRNGSLPANIADVAQVIIDAARKAGAPKLQEQLDFALHPARLGTPLHR